MRYERCLCTIAFLDKFIRNEPILINMPITVKVSDEILKTIPTINEGVIQGLIELGAKQMRIEEALTIFKEGKISIWRASRIAGLPLREMIAQASARGFKPFFDDEMIAEELE